MPQRALAPNTQESRFARSRLRFHSNGLPRIFLSGRIDVQRICSAHGLDPSLVAIELAMLGTCLDGLAEQVTESGRIVYERAAVLSALTSYDIQNASWPALVQSYVPLSLGAEIVCDRVDSLDLTRRLLLEYTQRNPDVCGTEAFDPLPPGVLSLNEGGQATTTTTLEVDDASFRCARIARLRRACNRLDDLSVGEEDAVRRAFRQHRETCSAPTASQGSDRNDSPTSWEPVLVDAYSRIARQAPELALAMELCDLLRRLEAEPGPV